MGFRLRFSLKPIHCYSPGKDVLGRKRLPYGDGSGVHEAAAQMKVSTDLDISGEPGSGNQAEFFAGI